MADLRTLSARIKRAARTQEGRAVVLLVKGAAPIAALAGRLDLVAAWLSHVPCHVIDQDPQLLYWSGSSILLQHPSEAHDRFQRSFEMLRTQSLSNATLLAWAGLVDAIFLMYRDLRELDALFDWMTLEREQAVDRMPRPLKSLVVNSAFFALIFRCPNHARIGVWRDRAERLVELDPTSDLGSRQVCGLILDYTWRGNLAAAEIVSKRFQARAARVALSPMSSVMCHVNEATLRLHQGRLQECIAAAKLGLATAKAKRVRLWDGVMHCHLVAAALSLGDLRGAGEHIAALEQLFADGVPIDEAYYRGMLAEYGFAQGDHVGALARCANALEIADAKGVPYFMAACRVMNGLRLFESGHQAKGRAVLEEGMSIGRSIANPMLNWIGGLFDAHMHYATGNTHSGDEALLAALQIGRAHALAHFFSWPRRVIANLIDRALERDFTPDYIKHLIGVHAFVPGGAPARSDQWAFDVRIYTFGEPRVVHGDGRLEPLSAQFVRQIELLTILIERHQRPVSLVNVATEMYADEDVDPQNSLKRVLRALRDRVGAVIVQREAALALHFERAWVDACTFVRLRQDGVGAAQLEAWLDRHYHGHFMDRSDGSALVERVRGRLRDQAERVIAEVLEDARGRSVGAFLRLEDRWRPLFPQLFFPGVQ